MAVSYIIHLYLLLGGVHLRYTLNTTLTMDNRLILLFIVPRHMVILHERRTDLKSYLVTEISIEGVTLAGLHY